MWKRICKVMRKALIEVWDGKIHRPNQRHGKMETNSCEGNVYDEDGGMRTAPEIRKYDNGRR